jgi:hypothetical protein
MIWLCSQSIGKYTQGSVYKTTRVGEVFSTSPLSTTLLCLLSFHLLKLYITTTFAEHRQTYNAMKLFDSLISFLKFYSKSRMLGRS